MLLRVRRRADTRTPRDDTKFDWGSDREGREGVVSIPADLALAKAWAGDRPFYGLVLATTEPSDRLSDRMSGRTIPGMAAPVGGGAAPRIALRMRLVRKGREIN